MNAPHAHSDSAPCVGITDVEDKNDTRQGQSITDVSSDPGLFPKATVSVEVRERWFFLSLKPFVKSKPTTKDEHKGLSKSDKKAKKSALLVRSLIVGPTASESSTNSVVAGKPQLSKVKSQLIQPKTANKVIAQLRALPVSNDSTSTTRESGRTAEGPIHAVCLEHTEAEEDALHFSKLKLEQQGQNGFAETQAFGISGIGFASFDTLTSLFDEMHVIDLIKSPDLGLGQPGDGIGLLAGAVPTAETVLEGVMKITPQLMALGYATGKAVLPDHKGIYPPTDRISILTYWWGLELLLPPPTLKYLDSAQSISGAVINFLTALSLINNGVREIIPFVRYIAQFMDFEFNSIKKQDCGRGVVCAATWIMPAAMVPRPWDFPPPINPSYEVHADSLPNGTSTVQVIKPSPVSLLDAVESPPTRPSIPTQIVTPSSPKP